MKHLFQGTMKALRICNSFFIMKSSLELLFLIAATFHIFIVNAHCATFTLLITFLVKIIFILRVPIHYSLLHQRILQQFSLRIRVVETLLHISSSSLSWYKLYAISNLPCELILCRFSKLMVCVFDDNSLIPMYLC